MSNSHNRIRLPSLRAIQAIDATARIGSFTGAAQSLNVTQGAVSRQIQALEGQLSVRLFNRKGPKVKLTETGRLFAEDSARALEILKNAVITARQDKAANHVTLSMLPSVASKWLAPRLGRFIDHFSDIDLRVTASRHLVNFELEDIDGAIRYGQGSWQGLDAILLSRETVFPVCAPGYAEDHALHSPAELANTTLLYDDIEEDWTDWFRKASVSIDKVPMGPRLGDGSALLQAAIEGQGVAMGRSILVADDLAAGRLIVPFDIPLEASFAYWFVTPHGVTGSPNLRRVKEWILNEFKYSEELFSALKR